MQLLANSSSEYGHTEGLSWIDGEVNSIKIIQKYQNPTYGMEFNLV